MALQTKVCALRIDRQNPREIFDVVYRIDPTENRYERIEKEKAPPVITNAEPRALAAVNTANAQIEGAMAVADCHHLHE